MPGAIRIQILSTYNPTELEMRRNTGLVTCIRLGEVFSASASAFFSGPKSVPGILGHVISSVRSSRLPQALFFRPPKNLRNAFGAEEKAPVAAGKTSPSLIYCIKCLERHFCRKKAPAAAGKTSPGYHSQMALAIFVIGHSFSQFEL